MLSVFPPAWRIYHRIARWSMWQMQKTSKADALANVRRQSGQEDIVPAAWVEGEEDEKDTTGWKVKGSGENRYDASVTGRDASRMGRASMIHINEDDPEQGTWTEAMIDNVLQADREKYLFHDADLKQEIYQVASPDLATDGGHLESAGTVSIDSPGTLVDALIPLNSMEGFDGTVVSWDRYQTLKQDQSGQDSVRQAKNSAWAAAKLDSIEGEDIFKWALIIGAWSFILLFHKEIGAAITGLFGGGGGGGATSIIPIGMMVAGGLL